MRLRVFYSNELREIYIYFIIIIVWLVISIGILRDYTFILVYASVFVNMQFSILLPD